MSQAWRRQTDRSAASLTTGVLKFPVARSRTWKFLVQKFIHQMLSVLDVRFVTQLTCWSAGTEASPNQKVRTDMVTEERRAMTKSASPSLKSLEAMAAFSR